MNEVNNQSGENLQPEINQNVQSQPIQPQVNVQPIQPMTEDPKLEPIVSTPQPSVQPVSTVEPQPMQEPVMQPAPQPMGNPQTQPMTQSTGNSEPPKKEKKSHAALICITIIIVAIAAGVSVYFLTRPTDSNEPKSGSNDKTTETTNNKTDNTKTEEKTNYEYLLKNLFSNCDGAISDYLNLDKMSDDTKIQLAIDELEPIADESIKVKSTDSFDLTGCKKEGNVIINNGIRFNLAEVDGSESLYSATDVENKIKSIFGKNTKVNHHTTSDSFFDKTINAYVVLGHGCDYNYDSSWIQEIIKTESSGNYVYIYTAAGSLVDSTLDKPLLCFKDDYDNVVKSKDCMSISSLGEKYKSDEMKYSEYGYDYDQYIKDNSEKFAQYKYTFEKEDDNYIIKGLEKIK